MKVGIEDLIERASNMKKILWYPDDIRRDVILFILWEWVYLVVDELKFID